MLVAAAISAFALAAPAGGGRQLQTSRLEVVSANIVSPGRGHRHRRGSASTQDVGASAPDVGAPGSEIYLQGYDAGDKLSRTRAPSTIEGVPPKCVLAEFYDGLLQRA